MKVVKLNKKKLDINKKIKSINSINVEIANNLDACGCTGNSFC